MSNHWPCWNTSTSSSMPFGMTSALPPPPWIISCNRLPKNCARKDSKFVMIPERRAGFSVVVVVVVVEVVAEGEEGIGICGGEELPEQPNHQTPAFLGKSGLARSTWKKSGFIKVNRFSGNSGIPWIRDRRTASRVRSWRSKCNRWCIARHRQYYPEFPPSFRSV